MNTLTKEILIECLEDENVYWQKHIVQVLNWLMSYGFKIKI